jgi:hypothetical protein
MPFNIIANSPRAKTFIVFNFFSTVGILTPFIS